MNKEESTSECQHEPSNTVIDTCPDRCLCVKCNDFFSTETWEWIIRAQLAEQKRDEFRKLLEEAEAYAYSSVYGRDAMWARIRSAIDVNFSEEP